MSFRSSSPVVCLALALGLLSACRGRGSERGNGDSAASTPPGTAAAAAAPVAWKFSTPPSWVERTESVPVDDAERTRRYPGARAVERFDYLPADATIARQTLLLITVYDSATWGGMSREGGPPVGEVITKENGNVYVASLPQSNPFAPGSADAKAFEARTMTIDDVRKAFRVVK